MNYIHYITSEDIWNILLIISTIVTSASAIMLPLLLNTISRIDEKYLASLDIVHSFKNSSPYNMFYYSAIASFILLGISIILILTTECCCINVFFVILTACFIVVLLVGLFTCIELIYKFHIPSKLYEYLKKRYKKTSNVIYFNAIKKVLHYVIRSGDTDLRDKIMDFFTQCVKNQNKKNEKWRTCLHNFANETLEFSFSEDGPGTRLFDNSVIMEFFFKEEMDQYDYNVLWANLVKAVCRKKEQFVLEYFSRAETYLITNQKVNKPIFREFHYIVLAMILYSGNYFLLKRIIMKDRFSTLILKFDSTFANPISEDTAMKYPFPDITENYIVKSEYLEDDWGKTPIKWTNRIYALLFIRDCKAIDVKKNNYYSKLNVTIQQEVDKLSQDINLLDALGLKCE